MKEPQSSSIAVRGETADITARIKAHKKSLMDKLNTLFGGVA